MLIKQEEKRRFPRIDLRVPLRFQVLGQPRFDNTVIDNVSAGGLGFTADVFIPTATEVLFEFNLLSRMLRFIGKIAWSAPLAHANKNRFGVQLESIEPLDKRFLKEYLTMQLQQ